VLFVELSLFPSFPALSLTLTTFGGISLLLLLLRGFFAKRVVNDKGEWFIHPPPLTVLLALPSSTNKKIKHPESRCLF
jgi:hypothetical protein